MCDDAAADGVTTLEIRFAPQLHDPLQPERIVDAALEGIDGRAGLILCGLYGESPEQLQKLVRIGATRPGVVGLDLAGGPTDSQLWRLRDYRAPFHEAAQAGLGRTVHAAEGRPPEEIRIAITDLGAQRIGHGTTLLNDPSVLELVRETGVTIEACPSSNIHTGVIKRMADHPIGTWLSLNVKACINTDNTLLSNITQSEELTRSLSSVGMTKARLERSILTGHQAAFERTKQLLNQRS
jgi:adenosine deaminase